MSSARDRYESVIGLEVHSQLLTRSKMFCSCSNQFAAETNTNICPVCTGQPGSLPVINQYAIELGVRAALALHCQIAEESVFARKNYFYPDLPKGYQISQYERPFCKDGHIVVRLKGDEERKIRIQRIHFEEDAGKSMHREGSTLVNLNRAGVPLIEIVSEPDIRTSHEAGQYLRTLRSILRYADVCDGNMEEGSFRCDANISVRLRGESRFGTRVELKNINSFRYVEKAIDYEIGRQIELIEGGGKVTQQTRSYDSAKNITELMREKEEAHDYRYFPEPDLPVLTISSSFKEEVLARLPELPDAKRERFQTLYSLSAYDAGVLTSSRELAHYFEDVVKVTQNAKISANWILNEMLGRLNAIGREIDRSPVTSGQLSELILRVESGEISGKMAKTVFEEMFATGKSPSQIIEEKGLVQISDADQLGGVIAQVLAANPKQVADYKAGKTKLLGFFVGQVMKETKGQANPALLNELVQKALNELS